MPGSRAPPRVLPLLALLVGALVLPTVDAEHICNKPISVLSGHIPFLFMEHVAGTCAVGVEGPVHEQLVPPQTSRIHVSFDGWLGVPSIPAHVTGRGLDEVVTLHWRDDIERYHTGPPLYTDPELMDDVVVTVELSDGRAWTSVWTALPG